MNDPQYEKGLAARKAVLGDEYVDRAIDHADSFEREFQEFLTRNAWGAVWTRPGLDQKIRSLLTIALLASQGRSEELRLHVSATRNTGASVEEIRETLIHVGVYAGVPASVAAFRIAKEALQEDRRL
jgi:4-carboxymuconolactone decarboxylase